MDNIELNLNSGNTAVKEIGFLHRVAGVIFSPGETMKELVRKPRILFAFFLVALSQAVLYIVRFPLLRDYLTEVSKASLELSSKKFNIEVTPELVEKTVSSQSVITLISTPVGSLFVWLMFTAILFGILKIFKGEGKFKQFMSVAGYAYIISALYLLITLIVSYFSGSLHITMPLTSMANLLPASLEGSFVYGFVKPIDIFSIWYYVVVGIGVVEATKLSKVKVYTVIFAMYAVTLVFAGISEMMMGQLM
jgi:hypothetical protein